MNNPSLPEVFIKVSDNHYSKKALILLLSATFTLRAPTQPNPPISPQSLRCNPFENGICEIDYFENDIITFLSRYASVIYELDHRMALTGIDLTHTFMNDYEHQKQEEKIDMSMEQIRRGILEQGIQYSDGGTWTKKATPLKRWKEKRLSSSKENTP